MISILMLYPETFGEAAGCATTWPPLFIFRLCGGQCTTGVGPWTFGAAMQPYRDTRPLLQEIAFPCRSGLVSR
ncbi:hypothetical protein E3U47_04790 [Pseudomonas sp. RIT623]|nr:hypothetical protein E3U47_04790 [Pseudomonas sp. RIT623]